MKLLLLFWMITISLVPLKAQRETILLNGDWDIEESISGNKIPNKYTHVIPVPGLVHLAKPAFKDVGKFESLEYLRDMRTFVYGWAKPPDSVKVGVLHQQRNYFWYRKKVKIGKNENAILKINKAQFGIAIWVNGKMAGEHKACFSSSKFDITPFLNFGRENEIVIRTGAHPMVLPTSTPTGTDQEKFNWLPGIYDDVTLILCNNPYIDYVQTAPNIDNSTVTIQTRVVNNSNTEKTFSLDNTVFTLVDKVPVAKTSRQVKIKPNSSGIYTQIVPIKDIQLWSPENPFLYSALIEIGGDKVSERFGMRKLYFDTKTKKAYLNNKIYYLRGSNICLHRFFDDPECGNLPWDEQWVRKLLTGTPKELNWNCFRFSIGAVPDKWFDIADEAGFIIQNEFFIWKTRSDWDTVEIKNQVKDWMRDHWNHASVGLWDICNETRDERLTDIIERVRGLDLSNRQWENGWNRPQDENDPVEDHPYKFISFSIPGWEPWIPEKYERRVAEKSMNSFHPTANALINNEYGWLWLHRDGTPTALTKNVFEFLCPQASNEERIETAAYFLGGETEYFRAHRNFAANLCFTYLTSDFPDALTSDYFTDVKSLKMHPAYYKYLKEAFKPLGVYLNFWKDSIPSDSLVTFYTMIVNDYNHSIEGSMKLVFEKDNGKVTTFPLQKFIVSEASQVTIALSPDKLPGAGSYTIKAVAVYNSGRESTTSLRKTIIYQKTKVK